jgi:amino acid transporter
VDQAEREGKARLFVREATGLVKNVSLLDAVSLNLSDTSAGAALANIGFTTILLPAMLGVNLVVGSIIGFVIIIPQIVIYTMMSQRMPRTGGDYIWASRTLGGFAGNVLAFIGYTLGNLPYAALIALSAVFAIGAVGSTMSVPSLAALYTPGMNEFLVAAVILAVLVGINVYRPRIAYKLITVFTIIGILTVVLAIATLLSVGRTGIENYMGSLGNANLTYTSVASTGTGPTFNWSSTLIFVPFFALFSYPWINAGPAVASEIKGKSALKWNVPVSALVVFALVTGGFATMYYVGGFDFINGALANSNLVYNYSFNFWTLAMGASGNNLIAWIIGVGWVLWIINILAYLIVVEARYLMAQSFDRFLPSKVTTVNKQGAPYIALAIDFVIILVMVGAASFYYGNFVALYGTIIGPMIYFMFVGIGAVIYAFRHEHGSAKATLIVAGILSAAAFAWLVYEFYSYGTAIWGASTLAYGYLVVAGVAAVVIYFVSKWYHKKRGIDISLTFKEIPPE